MLSNTMVNFIKDSVEKLKAGGFRITAKRKAILQILSRSKKPLSATEIREKLAIAGLPTNKVTVYRELDFLCNKRLVNQVRIDEERMLFEATTKHHHHTICVKCKTVKDIAFKRHLHNEEKVIEENEQFKILNHSLEFFGICGKCRN